MNWMRSGAAIRMSGFIPDWCMRCMEAIVARACGFGSRADWTGALSAAPSTRYHRDLQNAAASSRF